MPDVAGWVSYGASPRASLGLIAAGRALALIRGRDYVLPQDVLDVTADVLRHRLVLTYDALADGVPADHIVERVVQSVPLPQVTPRQRSGGSAPAAPVARWSPASAVRRQAQPWQQPGQAPAVRPAQGRRRAAAAGQPGPYGPPAGTGHRVDRGPAATPGRRLRAAPG